MAELRPIIRNRSSSTQKNLRPIVRSDEDTQPITQYRERKLQTPSSIGAAQAMGTSSLSNVLSSRAKKVNQPENIDVSVGDVVRELPRGAAKVGGALIDTFIKPIKTFSETTGGILGEGLAYATNEDVRKQYEAGNMDILPTVSTTEQKDVAKDTINAGVELALYKYLPPILKKTPVVQRLGQGALEGMGFMITDGVARDKTPEEIVKDLPLGAVFGAGASLAAPWLTRQLSKEVPLLTQKDKSKIAELSVADRPTAASKATDESPLATQADTTKVSTPTDTPMAPTERGTVEVPAEQLPVGSGQEKASRLAQRLSDVDDPSVPTYRTSNQKENIRKADEYFKGKTNELLDVAEGKKPMPKDLNVETNALVPVILSRADSMTPAQLVRAGKAENIRSLAATRAGQEISILQKVDPDNPITAIADLERARVAKAERSGIKVKEATKNIKKEGRKEMTKEQLKIKEAEDLINDLPLC